MIFGLSNSVKRLTQSRAEAGIIVLGVDFDPETVRRLRRQGLSVRFGDRQDTNFLESMPLTGVPEVVSTLPDLESNRMLLHALAARGYGGDIAVVARDEAQGTALKRAGTPTVLYPFRDA